MDRQTKIKLLQSISDGKQDASALLKPRVYFFEETSKKPGVYIMDGKEYDETQYREFCDRVRKHNTKSVIWHECRTY